MSQSLPALLITRPLGAAQRLAKAVSAECDVEHSQIISPLLKIEATEEVIDLKPSDAAVFTSVNGVEQAAFNTPISGQTAWCVGDQTAAAAKQRGFAAMSADGTASDLLLLILSQKSSGRFVHIRGEQTRVNLASDLVQSGMNAVDVVAYRQSSVPLTSAALDQITGSRFVVAPLFSPNTARAFAAQTLFSIPLVTVAMSAAVEDELQPLRRQAVFVAGHPNLPSMVASICVALRGNSGATGP